LAVDGIVGPDTKAALKKKLLDGNTVANPSTNPDAGNTPKMVIVSARQLMEIGWTNISNSMMSELNNCLHKFDITKTSRIRHFISQCAAETEAGKDLTERNWPGQATFKGDRLQYRGAGYIQLTGKDNYQRFADYTGDKHVMDGADYVARVYPWTCSGFWWHNNNMNKHCDAGEDVYRISQRVNCGNTDCAPNGFDKRKMYYEKCKKVFYS